MEPLGKALSTSGSCLLYRGRYRDDEGFTVCPEVFLLCASLRGIEHDEGYPCGGARGLPSRIITGANDAIPRARRSGSLRRVIGVGPRWAERLKCMGTIALSAVLRLNNVGSATGRNPFVGVVKNLIATGLPDDFGDSPTRRHSQTVVWMMRSMILSMRSSGFSSSSGSSSG